MKKDWWASVPGCLVSDVDGAKDLAEAVHLARIQLDLIEEEQDGTEHYSKDDVAKIKRWVKKNGG